MADDPKIILELTEADANKLAALLDAAVKSGGLPAACSAVPIFHALSAALEKSKHV